MDAVELARKLQEEATCSICLDYFTDPVMTTCGHNFCRECIQLTWEKAKGQKRRRKGKGSFPCPECRELSPQRNLRPNRLLTKVAEMARQHPSLRSRDLCQVHQEMLKLFCEDDQSPICVICRESQEHRPHSVVPIEEAVQEYKLKLEEDMGYLREEMMKTGKLQAKEEETLAEWQEKVKERRERIGAEFEKIGLFLLEEKQRLLQALKEEEEETVEKLQKSVASLQQQSRSLEMLLLQLEDRNEHPPLQMLQDKKDLLSRKNSLSVQYPEATPTILKTVCRVPGQIEVLKSFQALGHPRTPEDTQERTGNDLGLPDTSTQPRPPLVLAVSALRREPSDRAGHPAGPGPCISGTPGPDREAWHCNPGAAWRKRRTPA
ncbi:E3 ubiquitin-protein ligase TRIM17 isoform X1 [Hippopotamus amphibius kiboko]|uniref:E3 ubiquitin-protein ligase TRIM17 isoform X1 n=1 Tax=Hippopotamus amphibius kiboko TaxID=575201 RepID=UPI002593D1F0|nr:E3 ubiquitin-protein ligase TRIM17 isoform X1 [Hippopotamus amphibius kiboko]XP_057564691.1 E3 ubiquitin-protein ligase TRIM17 isoform X1 [Hippopotamus amphibius kiboko]